MAISTALITGGCGFLGSHLCERLLAKGFKVVAIDNFSSGFRDNQRHLQELPGAHERLRVVEADACRPWQEWAPLDFLGKDPAWVFHFASPASPPYFDQLNIEIMDINSKGLQQALELANALKGRLVFASTSEVYGDPEFSPQPESYRGNVNTWGPRACYDEAKRFGEALVYSYNHRFKTRHGAVRIFNTYGPRMNPSDGRVVINLLLQGMRNEKLTVFGKGTQTRSFCYVDDLVNGILAYAESDQSTPINIGNEKEFSILELAEKVKNLFPERKLEITHLPLPKDDPKQRRPDLTLARRDLKWEPRIPLETGLISMLEWMRANPAVVRLVKT